MPSASTFDPIPDWLRETRLRQRRADGKPWTQDDLIARMRQEIGWAPHRPNYSKYESGKAKPETVLPRFIDFWAKLGEPGPDYTAPEETAPPEGEAALAAAIREQSQMIGKLADAISVQTQEIRVAAVSVLAGQQGTGELLAQLVSAAREGTLDELLRELRAGPAPTGQGQ